MKQDEKDTRVAVIAEAVVTVVFILAVCTSCYYVFA